jgi:hypothetical protein
LSTTGAAVRRCLMRRGQSVAQQLEEALSSDVRMKGGRPMTRGCDDYLIRAIGRLVVQQWTSGQQNEWLRVRRSGFGTVASGDSV